MSRFDNYGFSFRHSGIFPLIGLVICSILILTIIPVSGAGDSSDAVAPWHWQGGPPTTGTIRVIVLLVEFPNAPHDPNQTAELVYSEYFGDGHRESYPYESLRNYYERSSYGNLNITGTVLGWYPAKQSKGVYRFESIIDEAFSYYDEQGFDFSPYDADNNGVIDVVIIGHAGKSTPFWGTYANGYNGINLRKFDNKGLNKYVIVGMDEPYDRRTNGQIHEFAHMLGIPDYYNRNDNVGPDGGLGGWDMMDGMVYDHNAFSKYMMGWLTPTVVGSGTRIIDLRPAGSYPDAVMIFPEASLSDPQGEYFLVEYRHPGLGNDYAMAGDGVFIWHTDAKLMLGDHPTWAGDEGNPDATTNLLHLEEADGYNHLSRSGGYHDVGDLYLPGKSFTPISKPPSKGILGGYTGVYIDNIRFIENSSVEGGKVARVRFSIGQPPETAEKTPVPTGTTSVRAPSPLASGTVVSTNSTNASPENSDTVIGNTPPTTGPSQEATPAGAPALTTQPATATPQSPSAGPTIVIMGTGLALLFRRR